MAIMIQETPRVHDCIYSISVLSTLVLLGYPKTKKGFVCQSYFEKYFTTLSHIHQAHKYFKDTENYFNVSLS